MPPYQKKTRMPSALVAPSIGPIEPRRRASARLASRYALVRLLEAMKLARLEREAADDAHAGEVRLHARRSAARAPPGSRACA